MTETCSLDLPVYFFDIGHPSYGQLTCQNKVSADQYYVTISRIRDLKIQDGREDDGAPKDG